MLRAGCAVSSGPSFCGSGVHNLSETLSNWGLLSKRGAHRQVIMEPGSAGMYPPYAQQSPPGGYAPPPNYVIHHRVEGVHTAPPLRDGYGNPYVYTDKVTHDPNCRYGDGVAVSPERRRKNRIANALAAAFIVCWCCTWPCHGPCCCGL